MNQFIRLTSVSFVLGLTLAVAPTTRATEPLPAQLGLRQLEEKFGRPAIRKIVEMTGTAGDPQPLEWRITTLAPGRNDLLREFWIGDQRITEEGLSDDYYPDRLPKGFFSLERVKLDSTQAFTLTEKAAREAGIGFDVINYKLHCREYSDEPVWTLTLLDREDTIVGSMHLSADSGKTLRTVWMRRLPNGRLMVQDSSRRDDLPATSEEASASAPASVEPAPDRFSPLEPPTPAEITAADIPPPAAGPLEKPAAGPAPTPEPADGEIPEIRQLQEAQEKTGPAE